MSRLLLTHARVVFATEVRDDVAILIDNGLIAALDPETVGNTRTLDLAGHLLIPGMIDLHCDALEKEVEPRPGVHFPLDFACAQADKRNAMAGITTVFHAMSFANHELGVRNNGFAAEIARGDRLWKPFGPSENALAEGWLTPKMMDDADLARTRQNFADAAERAGEAGFDIVEIHMAHGYLLQSFLSPLSNKRSDGYGGDRAGRMRFPLEVAEAVRAVWPKDKPLFVRISSVDGIDDGWEMDDSVALAHELKAGGIDVIDCSSGGNSPKGATNANLTRGPGYQVPFAERIKREVGIQTMAVGLIREPELAEMILQDGRADLIAVGRQALVDPFWALHAAQHFDIDPDFEKWPHQYAWWLEKWDKGLRASKKRELAAE